MSVDVVRQKIQHLLLKHGRVELDQDGDYSVRFGSARVFVRVWDWGDGDVVISLWAPVVIGATRSPELFEHVALTSDSFVFGHLGLDARDDGTVDISLSHRILGNYLDEPELMHAVMALVRTADQLDDDLAARFGGRTFHRA